MEDPEQESQNTMRGSQFKTSAYRPNSLRHYWQHHAAETLLFPLNMDIPKHIFTSFYL